MNITDREHVVLELISRGLTDREIAGVLGFSDSTARKHRENLLAKFQVGKSSLLVLRYLVFKDCPPRRVLPAPSG